MPILVSYIIFTVHMDLSKIFKINSFIVDIANLKSNHLVFIIN